VVHQRGRLDEVVAVERTEAFLERLRRRGRAVRLLGSRRLGGLRRVRFGGVVLAGGGRGLRSRRRFWVGLPRAPLRSDGRGGLIRFVLRLRCPKDQESGEECESSHSAPSSTSGSVGFGTTLLGFFGLLCG